MRSETPPIWSGVLIALGIFLWLAIVQALVTGQVKLTRNSSISRDERPEAFWGALALEAALGTAALVYGALHFGPGG